MNALPSKNDRLYFQQVLPLGAARTPPDHGLRADTEGTGEQPPRLAEDFDPEVRDPSSRGTDGASATGGGQLRRRYGAKSAPMLGKSVAFINLQAARAGPELRRPSGAPSAVQQRAQQVPANLEAHRVDRKVSDRLTKAAPSSIS